MLSNYTCINDILNTNDIIMNAYGNILVTEYIALTLSSEKEKREKKKNKAKLRLFLFSTL